jgi:uncharacterized protein with PQ loop repeat
VLKHTLTDLTLPHRRADVAGVELLETLTLILFAVLTVALNIPQAVRLWSTRDPSGLSVAGLLSGTVGYLAWVVYLSAQGQWVAMVATVVATLLWAGIATFTVVRRGASLAQVSHALAYAAVLGALAFIDLRVFGVALSLGTIWTTMPSVLEAWRAERITGLSVPSWSLYAAESLSWLAWAVMIEDPVLVIYGIVATTLGASILAAIVVRKEARHPAGTEAVSEMTHGMHVSDVEAEPSFVADPVNPLPADTDSSVETTEGDVEVTPVTPLAVAVAASI